LDWFPDIVVDFVGLGESAELLDSGRTMLLATGCVLDPHPNCQRTQTQTESLKRGIVLKADSGPSPLHDLLRYRKARNQRRILRQS